MAQKTVWIIGSKRLDDCIRECLTGFKISKIATAAKISPMYPSCGASPLVYLVGPEAKKKKARKSASRGGKK